MECRIYINSLIAFKNESKQIDGNKSKKWNEIYRKPKDKKKKHINKIRKMNIYDKNRSLINVNGPLF